MINCDQNYEITIMELTLSIIILKLICKKKQRARIPSRIVEWQNAYNIHKGM